MRAQLLRSHAAASEPDTLANWLALIALLALGIVWPPVTVHTHATLRQQAAAHLARSTCERSAR
jgi:hypothetical protein